MALEVTESLPNLKTCSPPKRVDAMESRTQATCKAIERQYRDDSRSSGTGTRAGIENRAC